MKEPEITTQGALAVAVCPFGVDHPPQVFAAPSQSLRGILQHYPEENGSCVGS